MTVNQIRKQLFNILKGKSKYYPRHLLPKVYANLIGGDEEDYTKNQQWYIDQQKAFEKRVKSNLK